MPTLVEIREDPNYINANPETKAAIFDRYSADDPDYINANDETKSAIRQKFGVMENASPQTKEPKMEAKDYLKTNPVALGLLKSEDFMSNIFNKIGEAAYKSGEKVSEVATNLGASPEVSGGLGAATNVGIQAVPMLYGGAKAKIVASPHIRSFAERALRSAIKPTLKEIKTGKASIAINTMLDRGINMTKGGVSILRNRVEALNDEIASAIAKSPESVDVKSILIPLKEKLNQFKLQINPNADISAIRKSWKEFRGHPLLKGQDEIPVQLAQKLKQGTYKQIEKKFGELSGASTEAQKAIARGLKEGIAKKIPAVRGLNAEESQLINTLNVVEKRVLLNMNKNPIGLSVLSHNPKLMALYLADKSSSFKGLIAKMANASKDILPSTAARVGIATGEAYGAKKARTEATQENK